MLVIHRGYYVWELDKRETQSSCRPGSPDCRGPGSIVAVTHRFCGGRALRSCVTQGMVDNARMATRTCQHSSDWQKAWR